MKPAPIPKPAQPKVMGKLTPQIAARIRAKANKVLGK